MAEVERVRIEVGFVSGQMVIATVPVAEADELQHRLQQRSDVVVELQSEDGVYHVAVPHVTSLKRFAREGRVGFGADA